MGRASPSIGLAWRCWWGRWSRVRWRGIWRRRRNKTDQTHGVTDGRFGVPWPKRPGEGTWFLCESRKAWDKEAQTVTDREEDEIQYSERLDRTHEESWIQTNNYFWFVEKRILWCSCGRHESLRHDHRATSRVDQMSWRQDWVQWEEAIQTVAEGSWCW